MKKYLLLLFVIIQCCKVQAQQKKVVDKQSNDGHVTQKISGTFKSTRVINAHSTEMLVKGSMDVRILHRFGLINQGYKQFYGLDNATMRIGFDFGVTQNLMVGIGRSTFRKELDAFAKIRFLQQTSGYGAIPVSILVAGGVTVWTEQSFDSVKPHLADRTAIYVQLIIGKKFTNSLSLQLSPILVNSGRAVNSGGNETIVALGGGGRIRISKRMAITIDYHHPLGAIKPGNRSPLSVGVDIGTGGHVFQLHFSNAVGMNERAYITQTTNNFLKGDIRFGFNLSRLFFLGKQVNSK